MLQFDRSQTTNKNAVYLDTVNTGSGYYDLLKVVYSQSYDRSSGSFDIQALSVPTAYTNWLLLENQGTSVPTASGQYDVEIFTFITGAAAVWNATEIAWDSFDTTWQAASTDITYGELLYSDRAFVSGSNESSITNYVSDNENGTYITYNG